MEQLSQNARGRISITSDLWSDDTLRAFMSVTAHYINCDGDLAEHLIAFRRIKGQHTGANIGQALFTVFNDAGILHKVRFLRMNMFIWLFSLTLTYRLVILYLIMRRITTQWWLSWRKRLRRRDKPLVVISIVFGELQFSIAELGSKL